MKKIKLVTILLLSFTSSIAYLAAYPIDIKIDQHSNYDLEYKNELHFGPNHHEWFILSDHISLLVDSSDNLEKITFLLDDSQETISISLKRLLATAPVKNANGETKNIIGTLGRRIIYHIKRTYTWAHFFGLDDTVYVSIALYDMDDPSSWRYEVEL